MKTITNQIYFTFALFTLACFALSLRAQAVDPSPDEGHFNQNTAESGGKIAFQSARDGNYEIYSINADGTNLTRLTDNPAIDRNPVFSHDGSMVAFVSNRYGHDNIFIMNADGSGVQRLTTGTLDDNPGWSTNDEEIVYSSLIGFDREIVIMNADGTGKHAITHNNNLDAQPDWSRDGKKIVFNRDYQIAVMNPDGTDSTVLTNLPGFNEWPHWSPSGNEIVFHSTASGNYQVYVMNADGTGITRITHDAAIDAWPVWSPNGQYIAFQSDIHGHAEIYIMRPDGSNLTRLTNNPAGDEMPSWGPVPGPITVTFNTNPAGLFYTVDGTTYNSAHIFSWRSGSSHIISTTSPQNSGGHQYVWQRWSDNGAISHTVAPTTPTAYTEIFTMQ